MSVGARLATWAVAVACGSAVFAVDPAALERERSGEESGAPVAPAPRDAAAHRRALAMLGTSGLLLVPDSTADRVMAFDAVTGDLVDADFIPADATNLSTPKDAILSADGSSILVSDQVDDVVQRYSLGGTFLGTFAPAGGANPAILDNILGIAYRPNGNLLVTVTGGANQDSIAEFDAAGVYLGNYMAIGAAGMDGPFDVHEVALTGGVLTAGDFLVPAINSDAVHRFNAAGAAQANFAAINSFPEQAYQIPTGPNAGNVLIANFSGTQEGIVELTSAGALVDVYDVAGLSTYRGVYELPNGNLLVTTGSGVHEITRAETLVETKIAVTGAQYIEFADVVNGPAIALAKTVGTVPAECATTDVVDLPVGGGTVYYCYEATNIGTVSFNAHDLTDDVLGPLFTGQFQVLDPGESMTHIETAVVTQTTVNTGTWTAYNLGAGQGGGSATASDTATVNVAVGVPAITLAKTVGTVPAVCAATDSVNLPAGGGTVYYCYEVTNTGTVSLSLHDLVDDVLGTLLDDFAFDLDPGESIQHIQSAVVTQDTVNTGTWTAFNPRFRGLASASDTATVTVTPSALALSLAKTVGTDPVSCAATTEIELPAPGDVTYCYTVTNTGNVALTLHDLVDSELGALLTDFPYNLLPGASAFLLVTTPISGTTVNTATWTGTDAAGASVSAEASATVTIVPSVLEIPTASGIGLAALALLLAAAAVWRFRTASPR